MFNTRPPPTGLNLEPTEGHVPGKGKGKAVDMGEADETQGDPSQESNRDPAHDHVERGSQQDSAASRPTSRPISGIESAVSSDDDSSILGDPDQQVGAGDVGEWGPQHPCYPHMNPHVPSDSPEFVSTRVIRIRRDWLLEGDLAPTFSNLYPEILDPAGLSEPEFRRVIEKLNGELVPAFDPYGWRNVLDGMLGLMTGWLWEDAGMTATKARLTRLERWIERWNKEMEKAVGTGAGEEGVIPPKIVSLRRTGYMTLDIQIPDPEIAAVPPATANTGEPSASGILSLEPHGAAVF